jgi:NAD(P)H-hydrate epimerase
MRKIEAASSQFGLSPNFLMQNAGKYMAEKALLLYDQLNFKKSIVILTGNGNNAGDGYVCAEMLWQGKIDVTVIMANGQPKTQLCINAFNAMNTDVKTISAENPEVTEIISNASIVIDCIFGTGFHGELPEEMHFIFDTVKMSKALKIACDIPSGACAVNGSCSEKTVTFDYTFTFGAVKSGMLLYPAREKCGQIIVCDIGIPKKTFHAVENHARLMNNEIVKKIIQKRNPDSHKGCYGKLLNISGSRRFTGAAALSTLAALRSGVGICTLAAPECVINALSSTIFEATFLKLDEDDNGQLLIDNIDVILKEAQTATAILVGCGLGRSKTVTELIAELIKNCECPLIIDADGINSMAGSIDLFRNTKASIILTPHPGEMARLTGLSKSEVFKNRVEIAEDFAKEYNVTFVSKGAGTVIISPDGSQTVCISGNAGLSRGGSGDVLSGMIAAFSAQGLSPADAAACAVYLHGTSADRVSQKFSMQGMLPTDVINELPLLFRSLDR